MFLNIKQNIINIVALDLFKRQQCDSTIIITLVSIYTPKNAIAFTSDITCTGRTNIFEIEIVDVINEDIMTGRINMEPGEYYYNAYETDDLVDEAYLIAFLATKQSDVYTTDPDNAIEVGRALINE